MKDKVKKLIIKRDASVLDALKIINEGGAQIALVVDSQNHLEGIVTDGDIRRGLIEGKSLSHSVESIMNCNPLSVKEELSCQQAEEFMMDKGILQIPIVDEKGILQDIILLKHLLDTQKRENTVVLMAGGMGTRLGELTVNCPKPMLKVGSKPILHSVIDHLKSHGFYKFVISLNYKADVIEKYFGDGQEFDVHISYIREKQKMGTAGSLSLLDVSSDYPILVMNGDILTKTDFSYLLDHHKRTESLATMCVYKYSQQIPFGVIEAPDGIILNIEEKPAHEHLISAGIYVLDPKVLSLVPRDQAFDMPDLFRQVMKQFPKKAMVFPIYEYWIDVGQKKDLSRAIEEFDEGSS